MEKQDSNSSSNIEEEKITETNLKISDITTNDTNKKYYSLYGLGSVEGEEKEVKNKDKFEKITLHSRPSVIERRLIESVKKMENVTKEKLELAEKINFKNNTDSLVETDEFGFFKNQPKKSKKNGNINKENNMVKHDISMLSKEELLKVNARTEKWKDMLANYTKYQTTKKSKLKSRTCKGVPDNLRSQVWQLFAETDKLRKKIYLKI